MQTKTKDRFKNRIPGGIWKAAAAVYHKLVWLRYKTVEKLAPGKMDLYCPCCGLKFKKFTSGDYWEFADYYDLSKFEFELADIEPAGITPVWQHDTKIDPQKVQHSMHRTVRKVSAEATKATKKNNRDK